MSLAFFFLKNEFFLRRRTSIFVRCAFSRFLFFVRHCVLFVRVAALSAAVKVKVPASSVAVVGDDKRGTQMVVSVADVRTYFRIKLIRKTLTDQLDLEGCYGST